MTFEWLSKADFVHSMLNSLRAYSVKILLSSG